MEQAVILTEQYWLHLDAVVPSALNNKNSRSSSSSRLADSPERQFPPMAESSVPLVAEEIR